MVLSMVPWVRLSPTPIKSVLFPSGHDTDVGASDFTGFEEAVVIEVSARAG
jgi:hypothetical protein